MAKKIDKNPKKVETAHVIEKEFAFTKENYIWFSIAFGLVILGFMLMSGGTEDIFSFRRIHLSSIVLMGGYIFGIFAIMRRRPKAE